MAAALSTPLAGAETTPAAAPSAAAQTLAQFMDQADRWLLTGASLPPELPRLLQPLPPADRLTAVAYLRRIGLLQGPALDLTTLLAGNGTTP